MSALPLVAYANRLPVQKIRGGSQASAGGLVGALRPALETRGGAWVGWDGAAETGRRALRWVHDYQLMLVPELLRARGAPGPIGFFLHTPFPAPEIFAR